MAVKKKSIKSSTLNEIIERGGKTAEESNKINEKDEVRFTLRISKELIQEIDKSRECRIGNVSRNQWIIEAIDSYLSM